MDTVSVPVSLKPYLPVYLELITESPILRDGGMSLPLVNLLPLSDYSCLHIVFFNGCFDVELKIVVTLS